MSLTKVQSAIGAAIRIVLDTAALDERLDHIENCLQFLEKKGSTTSGGFTAKITQKADLPTVAKYREVSERLDKLMDKFGTVARNDVQVIRKVSEKLQDADRH